MTGSRPHALPEESGMRCTTFIIEGLHCAGCAAIIRYLLECQPGVQSSSVSRKTRELRIVFDAGRVAEKSLVEAAEKAGYRLRRKN